MYGRVEPLHCSGDGAEAGRHPGEAGPAQGDSWDPRWGLKQQEKARGVGGGALDGEVRVSRQGSRQVGRAHVGWQGHVISCAWSLALVYLIHILTL